MGAYAGVWPSTKLEFVSDVFSRAVGLFPLGSDGPALPISVTLSGDTLTAIREDYNNGGTYGETTTTFLLMVSFCMFHPLQAERTGS